MSSMPWFDGPAGGTPLSAVNLGKLMVAADASTAGTPTGDALGAIADANAKNWTAVTVDGTPATSLPISSTDLRGQPSGVATLGSDGILTAAQRPDPDSYLGYAATVLFPQSAGGALTAGRTWYVRVGRGKTLGATKIRLYLGTSSSGSIMVGVHRPTGAGPAVSPGAQAVTSGAPQTLTSLGATAAGPFDINLSAATDVAEGDYLVLWGSDGTMAFGFSGMATAMPGQLAQCAYSDVVGTAGTALPSTPSALNGHSRMIYMEAR